MMTKNVLYVLLFPSMANIFWSFFAPSHIPTKIQNPSSIKHAITFRMLQTELWTITFGQLYYVMYVFYMYTPVYYLRLRVMYAACMHTIIQSNNNQLQINLHQSRSLGCTEQE